MLESQLDRLENSELVRRLAEMDVAYLFKHALVQETVRASLLNHERKRLNRLVGETLETLYPTQRSEFATLLADHYADAGDAAKTLEYSTLAGDAAMRVNANTEALAQFTRALAAALDLQLALPIQELFLKRGRVLELKNDYPAALENYTEMLRIAAERHDRPLELAALMATATICSIPSSAYDANRAQELSDRALELARTLDDKEAQAKILWNLMLMHSRVGIGLRQAMIYGQEALQIARENNLRERLAYLLNDLSPILVFQGEPELGTAYNLEARAMWQELGNLPMLADNLGYAVMNDSVLGDFDRAIAASEQALQLSRDINNSWNEVFSQTWVGECYLERGDVTAAERAMLAAIEMGQRSFPPALLLTRSDLARMYADFGKVPEGIELGKQALEVGDKRFPALRPWAVGALAHIYILAGRLDEARALLVNVPDFQNGQVNPRFAIDAFRAQIELALAEHDFTAALAKAETLWSFLFKNRVRQYQPDVLRMRAAAYAGMGDLDAAASSLEQAGAIARELGARWSLWHILAAASALETRRGNFAAAQTLRAEAQAGIDLIAARTPPHLQDIFLATTIGQFTS